MTVPARPGLNVLSAYVPGEAKLPGYANPIRLASNENALGASPKATEAFSKVASQLHRYPDPSARLLRETLAKKFQLDDNRIVCGAGSDELIELIAQGYAGPGDEVIYSQYGFGKYAITIISVGAKPVMVPEKNFTTQVDGILAAVNARTKIIFLANPNNPTGSMLAASDIRRLHQGLPPYVLLVLDAAYADYVDDKTYEAGYQLASNSENVIVLRTFSKIYALAALRIGWAYAHPAVIDIINRIRGPFTLSAPAQSAACAALEDEAHVEKARQHNRQYLPWFRKQMLEMGFQVLPSAGNFVLVRFSEGEQPQQKQVGNQKALEVKSYLNQQGIIIRPLDPYGLHDCLRITIGTAEEMKTVVQKLKDYQSRHQHLRQSAG